MGTNMTAQPADAVRTFLKENPNGSLANVLNMDQQRKKLELVADDILQNYLESKAYNCEPVKTFLRQILAGVVLEMSIQTCSKPEWINGWIVYLLEEGEPELMNAIDAGVGGATAHELQHAKKEADISERTAKVSIEEQKVGMESEEAHQKRVNHAEDAMDEAMAEAKRLSEMIAAEDAKKRTESPSSNGNGDSASQTTTEGFPTPSSSIGDLASSRNLYDGSDWEVETPLQTAPEPQQGPRSSFTDFDQLASRPSALHPTPIKSQADQSPPLTLHRATIAIYDDAVSGERGTIRSKPTGDYLLQIEPASSRHPGWMIPRKYADFETLHEVLRRISVVSGVTDFSGQDLPTWKGQTKAMLRTNLEKYLGNALKYERLAESEGMKRFLEKEQGISKAGQGSSGKAVFGFPSPAAFDSMGKGMLDVLASAPKGVAGGGKAVLGGVTGVFGAIGGVGQKKAAPSQAQSDDISHYRGSSVASVQSQSGSPYKSRIGRESQDSFRAQTRSSEESTRAPTLAQRTSTQMDSPASSVTSFATRPNLPRPTASIHQDKSSQNSPSRSQSMRDSEDLGHLPPPPSDMPDDYGAASAIRFSSTAKGESQKTESPSETAPTPPSPTKFPSEPATKKPRKNNAPLTEQETQMSVELFFAIINELYMLSSAWNIRKTLLNAAKTFLLRPGNPNLESIRVLIQDSIIESNTSDAGLAAHLLKLRENTLPTEEELKAWPPPPSEEDKERLRRKARKLLVERGMPAVYISPILLSSIVKLLTLLPGLNQRHGRCCQ